MDSGHTFLYYSIEADQPFDFENKLGAHCSWDFHPFVLKEGEKALTVPTARNKKGNYTVWGYYCSDRCALADCLAKYSHNWKKVELFKNMLKEVYGYKDVKNIRPAFPRTMLIELDPVHGLPIDRFRRDSQNSRIQILDPPQMMVTRQVWKTNFNAENARKREEALAYVQQEEEKPVKRQQFGLKQGNFTVKKRRV